MHTRVRVSVLVVNCGKFDMLGPIISENDQPFFLLHGSLRPTNLKKSEAQGILCSGILTYRSTFIPH